MRLHDDAVLYHEIQRSSRQLYTLVGVSRQTREKIYHINSTQALLEVARCTPGYTAHLFTPSIRHVTHRSAYPVSMKSAVMTILCAASVEAFVAPRYASKSPMLFLIVIVVFEPKVLRDWHVASCSHAVNDFLMKGSTLSRLGSDDLSHSWIKSVGTGTDRAPSSSIHGYAIRLDTETFGIVLMSPAARG